MLYSLGGTLPVAAAGAIAEEDPPRVLFGAINGAEELSTAKRWIPQRFRLLGLLQQFCVRPSIMLGVIWRDAAPPEQTSATLADHGDIADDGTSPTTGTAPTSGTPVAWCPLLPLDTNELEPTLGGGDLCEGSEGRQAGQGRGEARRGRWAREEAGKAGRGVSTHGQAARRHGRVGERVHPKPTHKYPPNLMKLWRESFRFASRRSPLVAAL